MPTRRRTWLWFACVVGLAVTAAVAVSSKGRRGAGPRASGGVDGSTPMPELVEALRASDARALAVLYQKGVGPAGERPSALSDDEGAEWVAALDGVRTGYPKFSSNGRATALMVVGRTFERLAVEPAPACWAGAKAAANDLLKMGLADKDLDVRATALVEISKLWTWFPGRAISTTEESALNSWRDGFVGPVVRRLGDREPKARASAVACLGRLPIDKAAAPAVAYLDDPDSPEVRKQVLVSFAHRTGLLTEDAMLKHMFDDRTTGVPEAAEVVLKLRGLTQEQISLGSMIFHPKAAIRASVIPLLKDRTDIDPVVWLLQLSRDADESVRMGTVEALAARLSPEIGRRLAEMAATDASPSVRRAAGKHLPEIEKTAALPPLPAAAGLTLKAN